MIAIIDYGMGNLRSVVKAFQRINVNVAVTSVPQEIEKASAIVLPGVGHFAKGMEQLQKLHLKEIICEQVFVKKKKILGICLGMQLLTNRSEEGNAEGFCLIDAETKHFKNFLKSGDLKIPHMGWNTIKIKTETDFSAGISEEDFFYFVHSYYVECKNMEDVIFSTEYGSEIHSGFRHENIYGLQFHPEKSYDPGLKLLSNFSKL
ncbi:MAG: imidazole glycerol phosphate synthase subunit HisH [Bacteroidales bacterium]|jgi:glutamine amidotransferase